MAMSLPALLLVNHSPEVTDRFLKNGTIKWQCGSSDRQLYLNWSLSADEYLSTFIAFDVIGVYVVRAENAVYFGQSNSRLIVTLYVWVTVLREVFW